MNLTPFCIVLDTFCDNYKIRVVSISVDQPVSLTGKEQVRHVFLIQTRQTAWDVVSFFLSLIPNSMCTCVKKKNVL